ncbi:hypothetical protein LINGRAHAP2_LOCUS35271 [Linum grandiflorum]
MLEIARKYSSGELYWIPNHETFSPSAPRNHGIQSLIIHQVECFRQEGRNRGLLQNRKRLRNNPNRRECLGDWLGFELERLREILEGHQWRSRNGHFLHH